MGKRSSVTAPNISSESSQRKVMDGQHQNDTIIAFNLGKHDSQDGGSKRESEAKGLREFLPPFSHDPENILFMLFVVTQ